MKERLKEIGYWLEDKLKDLCGEITPDKRITVILIMLLVFTIGNLYFTFSTIHNWGKESEKRKQLKIDHIKQPELERNKNKPYDFFDSEIDKDLFDLQRQKMWQDSINTLSINKQKFKEYERATRIKYLTETKA